MKKPKKKYEILYIGRYNRIQHESGKLMVLEPFNNGWEQISTSLNLVKRILKFERKQENKKC